MWTNRLWILSAALGAVTLGSAVAIVHDTGRQRAAAALVAKSTAEQVAAAAAGRLEILALETFAPATPWERSPEAASEHEVSALVRAQRNAAQCRCRDTLPADAFFRFDVATGALEIAPVGATPAKTAPRNAVEALARAEAERARTLGRSTVHFVTTPALGENAAVTIVQSGAGGAPLAVYGLVADARHIARAVFPADTGSPMSPTAASAPAGGDSLSLEVRPGTGPTILGHFGDDRPIRGTIVPATGPLQGIGISVALTRRQAARSLHLSQQQLWHMGVLTLATILVVIFAVGSSRRELLLARARSDFIAGVSHDLRMPLAQILIASETLTMQRERDADDRVTLSSSIVREARRLIGIVDNVLLFSRSGAVALRPHVEPLAVSALFDDVIDAVKLAVDDAGQTIDVREPSRLAIFGDRQLLRQALVNLVDNALKYGAAGQRIRLGAERHGASSVRLFVEDEGPGVPHSERSRIFEPYERLTRDQTSERTGTGLGLAVVRHIAQVSDGRVWLEESPSGGTRVVLELPIAEVVEAVVEERELV